MSALWVSGRGPGVVGHRARRVGGRRRFLTFSAGLACIAAGAHADEANDPFPRHTATAMALRPEDGDIRILEARLVSQGRRWYLFASADFDLPEAVRAGLDSGVPLVFSVEFELQRPRRWWWPEVVFDYQQSYTVVYYELTRHYRVQAVGAQQSRNYRSLLDAFNALGALEMALPVGLPAALNERLHDPGSGLRGPGSGLQGRLQIRLDRSALPLPLQSMLSRSWRLASREYVWPLN